MPNNNTFTYLGQTYEMPNRWANEVYGISGTMPSSALKAVPYDPWGRNRMIPVAADSLASLARAAQAAGINLGITETYRPMQKQIRAAKTKPESVAIPGSSIHGYGRAVDFNSQVWDPNTLSWKTRDIQTDPRSYNWLLENAPRFGFVKPDWALNRRNEMQHFEFAGMPGAYNPAFPMPAGFAPDQYYYAPQLAQAKLAAEAPARESEKRRKVLEAKSVMKKEGVAGLSRTGLLPIFSQEVVGPLKMELPERQYNPASSIAVVPRISNRVIAPPKEAPLDLPYPFNTTNP